MSPKKKGDLLSVAEGAQDPYLSLQGPGQGLREQDEGRRDSVVGGWGPPLTPACSCRGSCPGALLYLVPHAHGVEIQGQLGRAELRDAPEA